MIQEHAGRIDSDSGNWLPVMNSQFRVLITILSSFAVAAIDWASVFQIVWLVFKQTTEIGDEKGILAVF